MVDKNNINTIFGIICVLESKSSDPAAISRKTSKIVMNDKGGAAFAAPPFICA